MRKKGQRSIYISRVHISMIIGSVQCNDDGDDDVMGKRKDAAENERSHAFSIDVHAPKFARAGIESGASVQKLWIGCIRELRVLRKIRREQADLEVIRNHVVTRRPRLLEAESSII